MLRFRARTRVLAESSCFKDLLKFTVGLNRSFAFAHIVPRMPARRNGFLGTAGTKGNPNGSVIPRTF
jgi:hypothetical protein